MVHPKHSVKESTVVTSDEMIAVAGIKPKEQSAGWRGDQPRPPVGRDKSEAPQGCDIGVIML